METTPEMGFLFPPPMLSWLEAKGCEDIELVAPSAAAASDNTALAAFMRRMARSGRPPSMAGSAMFANSTNVAIHRANVSPSATTRNRRPPITPPSAMQAAVTR